ncbi:MAG: helix-turn-helix domain-containing protein [Micrococcaceae bacterium]
MAPAGNFAEAKFMTVNEVAEMMRVSRMTVYRMIHAGELPAVRFGRSYRVPENAVQEILSTGYTEGTGTEGRA